MRGYSNTKSNSFRFQNSFHKYPPSNGFHGDNRDNLYKILCSWLNFREFTSKGSIEVDKILSVFTAMFHADNKQEVKKLKKDKFRNNSHIVKIDLDKIDTNLNLSNKQKIKLKQILNKIKYHEFENKSMKKENKRSAKSITLRKKKKIVETVKGRTRRTQPVEETIDERSWERSECKNCKLCTEEGKSHLKRNHKRSITTFTTPSEEQIFKTLMHLDRSCCGESFKKLFDSQGKRTYISQNQNINIENVEFKYIQPTCLVQCTGMKEKLSIDFFHHPRSKFHTIESIPSLPIRTASNKSLMTDTRQDCLKNKVSYKPGFVPPYIDEVDEPFEKTKSTYQQGDAAEEFDYEKHLELLRSFCDEGTKRHSDANVKKLLVSKDLYRPSFDKVDNQDIVFEGPIDNLSEDVAYKEKISKYRKLKNFAKTCLCMGGGKNKSKNQSKFEMKGKDSNHWKLNKINSPTSTWKNEANK